MRNIMRVIQIDIGGTFTNKEIIEGGSRPKRNPGIDKRIRMLRFTKGRASVG
jgi:hypothetical protein